MPYLSFIAFLEPNSNIRRNQLIVPFRLLLLTSLKDGKTDQTIR